MESYLPVITLGEDVAYSNFFRRGRKLLEELSKYADSGVDKSDLIDLLGYNGSSKGSSAAVLFSSSGKRGLTYSEGDKIKITDIGIIVAKNFVPKDCVDAFNVGGNSVPIDVILVFLAVCSGYESLQTIRVASEKGEISGGINKLIDHKYIFHKGRGIYCPSTEGRKLGEKIIGPILAAEDIIRKDERERYRPRMIKKLKVLASEGDPIAKAILSKAKY